ncbi:MAG: hypothetical protein ABIJ82_00215 [Patescibacteria group bacterium]
MKRMRLKKQGCLVGAILVLFMLGTYGVAWADQIKVELVNDGNTTISPIVYLEGRVGYNIKKVPMYVEGEDRGFAPGQSLVLVANTPSSMSQISIVIKVNGVNATTRITYEGYGPYKVKSDHFRRR